MSRFNAALIVLFLLGSTSAQLRAATPSEALEMPVILEFVDTPAQDVIDYLQDYLKVKIELDAEARGKPWPAITVTHRDMPLKQVFGKTLAQAELTYEVLPDRFIVRPLNPGLPPSEYGHQLTRSDAAAGWISLFDGKTTLGWKDTQISEATLRGGSTTSQFGHYELVAYLPEDGTLELGGQRIEAKRGTFRQEVQGKAHPIRLLDNTAVRLIRIRPLGLKSLFNGRDIFGWQKLEHPRLAAEKRPSWTVAEGAIRAVGGPGALEYHDRFADFVLQIDVRTRAHHANGGLFFRSIPGDFMNGYEAQIYNRCEDNDPGRPSVWSTASIDDRMLARRLVSRDFVPFRMTVVANGPHIATWVNGHQLIDWTDTRPPHDNPRQGLRLTAGTLQLQAHDPATDVEFLSVQIAPLGD